MTAIAAHLQALSPTVFENLLIRADQATVTGSLARGMAHDLRGPLQTLTLLIDPQADQLTGPDGARLRTAVGDAVQHLTETVTRFGDVNTPPAPEAAPVIVDDLLGYVAGLERYQRGLPAVEVELRLAGGMPPVRGIEHYLRHVLLGLILNAKEAMVERPDSRLILAASASEGTVQLIVEDNGPGVTESTRDRAFDPFFTTRLGHLGIGLTVARWLLERQGGTLELLAGEMGGARAVMLLPSWRHGPGPLS